MTSGSTPVGANSAVSNAILVLSLAAFGSGISQRVMDPLLPRLAVEFGVALGTASWSITCFTIGYALCQSFFGLIGDSHGKYRVIAWGCAASAAASLLCALSPNLPLLLLARVIAGGMTAAIIPLSMAWIGDVVDYEHRQPVLARFLMGSILGVSAGQLLGGLSADYLGWRLAFFLVAGLFLAGTLLLFAVRRQLPPQALATQPIQQHALRHLWIEYVQVLSDQWAKVVLLAVFLEGALVFGSFAFLASHLHRQLALSLSAAGTIVMLFGLGGLLFAAASRTLVRRLGEAGLSRWGACILSFSMCALSLSPNVWVAAPACFLMGLGFYMLHNTLQTNATQMAPERRGAAVSIFAFCYFIGQSTGIAIAGWLVGHISIQSVILSSAVGVLLVGTTFARQKRLRMLAVAA